MSPSLLPPTVDKGPLPDPFMNAEGSRLQLPSEWPKQSAYWRELILKDLYGGLPPAPDQLKVETLSHSHGKRWRGEPNLWTYRLTCLGGQHPLSFTVRLVFPDNPAQEPFPAVINGDGCWAYLSDDILEAFLGAGIALVLFNRTELAEDLGYAGVPDKHKRSGGLYDCYPGSSFGAVSAWAWGYHRCVDLLEQLPFIDSAHLAVTGHSRGGKASLLAGATDPRISVVNDNASCAAGSALFRYVGHGGETLDILNAFPSWFGTGLRPYLGCEEDLPFDQHCLLATIAPRPLLLTYATDDRWSNPEGMVLAAEAAREVYRFLGADPHIAFHLRQGRHFHDRQDWLALLDFLGWKWKDRPHTAPFNVHPYADLRPRHSWSAP